MTYALQPHLYKNVPVYLWPWVWWQLFQIERWMKWTGRAVLGGVARDGKVYVLHWGDDQDAVRAWSPEDMRAYHTRHQGWLSTVSAVSPCGEVWFCEALRCCAPRFAKQVPYRFAHMNRAEGSHAAKTNGHRGVGALSPVHAPQARNPLSRVVRSTLARVRLQPLSQALATYNPTRHGDQLKLALWLHTRSQLMNTLAACNTPSRIAPIPRAQPPPLMPPAWPLRP